MLKTISKMQMVEERLRQAYGDGLFQRKDINAGEYGTTDAEMTTILNRLRQQNKLADFGVSGLYQFVSWNNDLGFPIEDTAGPEEVADFLYLRDNGGYYYGNDLLLFLGLSDQVSRMKTIASNNVSKKQFIQICNADLMVKPALAKVTAENKRFLQAVDTLLTPGMLSVDEFTAKEVVGRLVDYANEDSISIKKIESIVVSLDKMSKKKILTTGFYDALVDKKRFS